MCERPSVLIVDDDLDFADNIKDILGEAGYEVHACSDARGAIEHMADIPAHLVLLDLRLPDSDGIELLHGIKEAFPDTEAIVVTGYGSLQTAAQALDDQAFAYLTKPVDLDQLQLVMERALERQRAIEELRASEARYRDLVESASDVILIADSQANILDINRRGEELTGYSHTKLLRMNLFRDLIVPEDAEHLRDVCQRLVSGDTEHQVCELRWRTREGGIVHLEGRCSPRISDSGEFISRRCILRDTTERRRIEEALRETNETLEALIQASPLAIDILDRDGNVRLWNPAAERIFGWTQDEVLGKPPPFVPEDRQDEFRTHFEQVLNGGTNTWMELRRRTKDGSPVDISGFSAPMRDADGGIVGGRGIMADITAQKQLEAHLRQAQRLEAAGRLSAGIAHEFKNLLMGISGYAEILQIKLGHDHPEFALMNDLLSCVDRAAKLVSQLQIFGRRQPIEPRPTGLNELLTEMEGLLRRLLGEHTSTELNLSPDVGAVNVDPGQIEQALVNLAINARDAMPTGGRFTISARRTTVSEGQTLAGVQAAPGEYAEVTVSDTGTGMDEATMERIFEPFFTTKETSERSGLGLAVVYGIITQHRGYIEVTSEVGGGTTFRIYLPGVETEAVNRHPAERSGASGSAGTVLLAEDEDSVRLPVKAMLEGRGFTVLCAGDGEEAIELFNRHVADIDLVILDLIMPRAGGRYAWEAMRAAKPDLGFLFMSGHSPGSLHPDFMPPPDMPFLTKPVSLRHLADKVAELIPARKN